MIATVQLLPALLPFEVLLNSVSIQLSEKNARSISLSYSTIKLKLTGVDENSSALYFQCVFQIQQTRVKLVNIYVVQKDKQEDITFLVNTHIPDLSFNTDKTEDSYSPEVNSYLSIADTIAKQSYLCSPGDDYRPGYYSEIIVEETQFILRQINRHNSRSIDHKHDYHMRDLEFFIPRNGTAEKLSFQDDQIGAMRIHFSDHSSKNNKQCGDRIHEKINEEKLKFANS